MILNVCKYSKSNKFDNNCSFGVFNSLKRLDNWFKKKKLFKAIKAGGIFLYCVCIRTLISLTRESQDSLYWISLLISWNLFFLEK